MGDCTNASHDMQHPRTSNNQAYAWLSCQVSIRGRCIAGSLFVAEADESDAQIDGFLSDLDNRNAHDAEQHCHAQVAQTARNDLSTGRRH